MTSKLRPSLAIAADSAISKARRKSHCALNVPGRQIVLHEETVVLIVLNHIIWSFQKSHISLKDLTKKNIFRFQVEILIESTRWMTKNCGLLIN